MGAARESFRFNIHPSRFLHARTWRRNWRLIGIDNFAWMICAVRGHRPYNTATSSERDAFACERCMQFTPEFNRAQDRALCLLDGFRCEDKVVRCWCEHCGAAAAASAKVPLPNPLGSINRSTAPIAPVKFEPRPGGVFPNGDFGKTARVRAPELVEKLVRDIGGTIDSVGALPDGSGFATASYPLPKDHWLHDRPEEYEAPPMSFRMGTRDVAMITIILADECDVPPEGWRCTRARGHLGPCAAVPRAALSRMEFADRIRAAGRYALRVSTDYGREPDYDPDAVLQNLVVGLLGYWTENGLSADEWANPKESRRLS